MDMSDTRRHAVGLASGPKYWGSRYLEGTQKPEEFLSEGVQLLDSKTLSVENLGECVAQVAGKLE